MKLKDWILNSEKSYQYTNESPVHGIYVLLYTDFNNGHPIDVYSYISRVHVNFPSVFINSFCERWYEYEVRHERYLQCNKKLILHLEAPKDETK